MVTEQQPHRHPPRSSEFPDPRATDAREEELQRTLVRVVKLLSANGIRFAVAGECAAYLLGGPPAEQDLVIVLTREDAQRAAEALATAGMRAAGEREDRLNTVYDGDTPVELVFRRPNAVEVTEHLLDRASPVQIGSAAAPVIAATDLMIDKLHELGTHRCDFVPMVQLARVLGDRVDWSAVADATADSPYARAFLGLVTDLSIAAATPRAAGRDARSHPTT
ncbi:hypothetical protein [Rhodococcus opacus]|uniref:Nucleotidyltransferase-like protein n=1 Tax=Rhodococcus opacus TaxID=37919 RepID=A0AAX3YU81_RHOOP|nr:hypothetical protein [Rhodococcus opacus]MCZ4586032.1 hypothetical protein [Rhodococcus opacus]NHU48968.1 nucleotidyltransferase family protein [Rhodococcus sp. A14]WLF52019.1 hypothetical protein Q5707_41970 [Rhodococcus opacus]